MRTVTSTLFAIAGALIAVFAAACSSDDNDDGAEAGAWPVLVPGDPRFERDPLLDVELVSRRGGVTSHEAGANCMQCHQRRGPGPGQFTVAGTAYDEDGALRPDATLRLTDMGGNVVLEVEADAYGNFFSTAPLPWPEAQLFPSVKSADAKAANAMPFGTISGACNVCHTPGMRVVLRAAP